jgi:putative addiction module component (TIGR02574 family)
MEQRAILEAAMMLPENERLDLVSRLLESVPSDDATMSVDDTSLLEELDRRFADRDGGIPWSELQAEG